MEQFLTVKEATELVGKSESTIKRLLREVVKNEDHADRTAIQPTAQELSKKRDAGEPYVWRIERQFLLRSFPVDPAAKSPRSGGGDSANANAVPIIEVLNQQLQSKDRQIGVLEKQLDRKDEQIANQNERMHESNVLMRELQARLAITAPAATTNDEPVVVATKRTAKEGSHTAPSVDIPPDAKSVWTRPIRLFSWLR